MKKNRLPIIDLGKTDKEKYQKSNRLTSPHFK